MKQTDRLEDMMQKYFQKTTRIQEEEIEALKRKNIELTQQVDFTLEEKLKFKKLVTNLQNFLEKTKCQISGEKYIPNAQNKKRGLKNRFRIAQKTNECQKLMTQLSECVGEMISENYDFQEKMNDQGDDNEHLLDQIQRLKTDKLSLQAQITNLKRLTANTQSLKRSSNSNMEIPKLKKQITELNGAVADLESYKDKADQLEQINQDLENQLQEMKKMGKFNKTQEDKDQKSKQNEYKLVINQLKKEVQSLNSKVNYRNNKIDNLQEKLKQMKNSPNPAITEVNEDSYERIELEKQIEDYEKVVKDAKKTIKNYKKSESRLNRKIESLKKKLEKQTSQTKQWKERFNKMDKEGKMQQKRLSEKESTLNKELKSLQNEKQLLEEELKICKNTNEELHSKIEAILTSQRNHNMTNNTLYGGEMTFVNESFNPEKRAEYLEILNNTMIRNVFDKVEKGEKHFLERENSGEGLPEISEKEAIKEELQTRQMGSSSHTPRKTSLKVADSSCFLTKTALQKNYYTCDICTKQITDSSALKCQDCQAGFHIECAKKKGWKTEVDDYNKWFCQKCQGGSKLKKKPHNFSQ